MNTDLRKKAENDFEKYFFKMKNNVIFGNTMENVRKPRDIKLVTTKIRKKYFVSNQIILLQNFTQKFYYQYKWKNRDTCK